MNNGANVTGIVRAPIAKVWQVFRPFGNEIRKWWTIYKSLELEPPGKDEVGAVRHFQTLTGREYRERLEARDDQQYLLKYSLVETQPIIPSLKNIVTTVEMSAKSANETIIHWSSQVEVDSVFAGQIISAQQKAYTEAIQALDKYFNPCFGQLEVELISGNNLSRSGLFLPDPYVVIHLDEGTPQESKICFQTCNPLWKQKLTFDVLNLQGELRFSVWDANLGRDNFLGSADLNLNELTYGQITRKNIILDGTEHGEINVSVLLNLDNGEKLPPTEQMEHEMAIAFLHNLLEDLKSQLMLIIQQEAQGEFQKYEYAKYPRRSDAPDLPLEDFPPMVKGLPPGQGLPPKKFGLMAERIAEYVYSELGFFNRLQKKLESGDDPWTAYYADWIPSPQNIPLAWKDDVEFCRQLIQGVNPMCIRVCNDIKVIPPEMRQLEAQGQTLSQLIAQKRLFILDYADLEDIPQKQDKVFYAPIVLVYRELLEDNQSRLNMVGIQLTRYKDRKNQVYTPNSAYPHKYLLAKIHSACADNQYHQFTYHLGLTHLAMEPFAISHHNAFPPEHPIGQLLKPHLKDTIGINYLARQTLIAKVLPFTDRTFATGTSGGLSLVLKAWKKWDFLGSSFPEDLKSRGFDEQGSDGVQDFYFREDGFKIWNALFEYTSDVVNAVYQDDAAVAADQIIQAWAQETADPNQGAVPGFPNAIATRELLAKTLTTIIFLGSAQHSAINFSQYQSLGYVPNRPNVLFKGIPETEDDMTLNDVFSALQSFPTAHFQVFFSNFLSTPSLHPMSELPLENNIPAEIHSKFMANLEQIAVEIEERNQRLEKAGKTPYPYLSPKLIATSIDT